MARRMGDAGADLGATLQKGVDLIDSACGQMTVAIIQQDWRTLTTLAKQIVPVVVDIMQGAVTLGTTEPLLASLEEGKGGRPGEERG